MRRGENRRKQGNTAERTLFVVIGTKKQIGGGGELRIECMKARSRRSEANKRKARRPEEIWGKEKTGSEWKSKPRRRRSDKEMKPQGQTSQGEVGRGMVERPSAANPVYGKVRGKERPKPRHNKQLAGGKTHTTQKSARPGRIMRNKEGKKEQKNRKLRKLPTTVDIESRHDRQPAADHHREKPVYRESELKGGGWGRTS